MKILFVLLVTLFVSCGQKQSPPISIPGPQGDQGLSGPAGKDGQNGTNGTNGAQGEAGFSLVSQPRPATPSECPNGGTTLDVYADLDRSGDVSPGDEWQSSLLNCQDVSGAVYRTPNVGFLDTVCVSVAGTDLFARKSTDKIKIFENSTTCAANDDEIAELKPKADEMLFSEGDVLLILTGSDLSNLVLRTVVFF